MDALLDVEPTARMNEFFQERDVSAEAIAYYCTQHTDIRDQAAGGFGDGDSVQAGTDIAAGAYRTFATGIGDCYWELSAADGETIANDFVTFAPDGITVTIGDSQGFTSDGCGAWVPA